MNMTDAATVQEELLDLYRDHRGIKRYDSEYSWSRAIEALPNLLTKSGGGHTDSGTISVEEMTTENYSEDGGSVFVIFRLETHDREVRFFRNDGYADSWSEPTWDGTLYEVRRAPKQSYDYYRI